MIEEVERFWVDNIIGNVEPDATTVTDVITKYARHTEGKIIEVSDDISRLQSTESGKSRTCQTRSHQRRTRIENQKGFGMQKPSVTEGQTLATWKTSKDSAKFDSKAFGKVHPDLAQEFTKIVPGTRRFILK